MERERNFCLVGGDLRQMQLAHMLKNDGNTVHTVGLEKLLSEQEKHSMDPRRAHCVILPLPVLKNGVLNAPFSAREYTLEEVFDALAPGQMVCGGMPSDKVVQMAKKRELQLIDYYAREECQIANAVPTAEGAIQVAMGNMLSTLHGTKALVIGFGRVGKLTAHRLQNLGARVTVASRKCEDWAWAEAYGYHFEDTRQLAYWMGGYDLIINTVPALILDEVHLERVQTEAFIIDLASEPGGVDMVVAEKLGLHAVTLPGLPGKTAPKTAAKAIKDTVYNILHEMGV